MGKLSYVIVMTTMSMMLFGCGREQDKTVINYCKALETGRLNEAAAYLSKDAMQELDRAGGKLLLVEGGNKYKLHKGIKSIKITKRKVAGDKATVEFVYNFNDGSKIPDYFPLVKEDGKWKISK